MNLGGMIMEIKLNENTPTKPFNHHWKFSVGSGHAALALRADYLQQLKFIKDELGIKYVRFHGIFNDDMHTLDDFTDVLEIMENGNQYQEENFYLCGIVYDNILSCGLKPFVELSFMPQNLAKIRTTSKGFYRSNFNMPENLSAWQSYISNFINYLLHRYGEEEVKTWFFEVWNEPDLKGAFFNGTKQEYFNLYKATAEAIKKVNPELRVGGPATSGSKWIVDFVDYCQKNDLPLDYVSTHQYSGDPLTGIEDEDNKEERDLGEDKRARLAKSLEKLEERLPDNAKPLDIVRTMFGDPSETKDLPNDVFKKNAHFVSKQVGDLPVYYTEWNMLATFSAYSNDTKKVAAYNVKTVLDIEESVTGSSVWCFSDIFEEMHQFKEEFHGGFGLQTIHGIPKPSFYGFKLLSHLSDNRYLLAEDATDCEIGYAAFKGEGTRKEIILFRQKMKQIDLPEEEVMLQFSLSEKPKKVIIKRIDDDHCNPLKLWEEDGCKKDLTHKEVENLKRKSSLNSSEIDFSYENNVMTLTTGLKVNDVVLIEID